jgi:hypothetical protein
MQPLIPFLLGEPHPMGRRLVDAQRRTRTGDIDAVGDDAHLAFFEMLGNWSLGDYGKPESLAWSFEFLTRELDIPLSRLAVTVFADDADAPRDDESGMAYVDLARAAMMPRVRFTTSCTVFTGHVWMDAADSVPVATSTLTSVAAGQARSKARASASCA